MTTHARPDPEARRKHPPLHPIKCTPWCFDLDKLQPDCVVILGFTHKDGTAGEWSTGYKDAQGEFHLSGPGGAVLPFGLPAALRKAPTCFYAPTFPMAPHPKPDNGHHFQPSLHGTGCVVCGLHHE